MNTTFYNNFAMVAVEHIAAITYAAISDFLQKWRISYL